ncbi:MAG: L,D-transpeptidase [Bdellovibrionaceae bacterium]|nr:L,D-transpeptidase [Pseudobdellovibrionaceae bacterium]
MKLMMSLVFVTLFSVTGFAQISNDETELNPFDPNIEQILNQMDQDYMDETGLSPYVEGFNADEMVPDFMANKCYRQSCAVWIRVVKSSQTAYFYQNGSHVATWKVSTGASGYGTPSFDRHPNGRIYDKYTSTKYPEGDYRGLGNMPYAVFIQGGFAIHGTTEGNIKRLGTRASHGCIRLHPDNGRTFNRAVRAVGIYNTWITVE